MHSVTVPHESVAMHPIMGTRVRSVQIYTRTIVMWATGIDIDIDALWQNLDVVDEYGQVVTDVRVHPGTPSARELRVRFRPTLQPVVRMVKSSKYMRGCVPKRISSKPFKSVLSVDIQHGTHMPNLKISRQNTIQITGCCDMALLDAILWHLTTTYHDRGFTVTDPDSAGFVCDIVLSNVFFKTPTDGPHRKGQLNRELVCEAFNAIDGHPKAVAIYEPLLNDASVSIKFFDDERPNDGHVYPLWSHNRQIQAHGWRLLNNLGFQAILPTVELKDRPICHTFRIFGSGSVVQVGRWPETMAIQQGRVEAVILSVYQLSRSLRPRSIEANAEHTNSFPVPFPLRLRQRTLWSWLQSPDNGTDNVD